VDDPLDAVDRAAEANARFRPVEIVGDVVTRPATTSTPTVHLVLAHLRRSGVTGIPEPLGIHDGRESLRFIDGESGGDGWFHQHTDEGLASAARFLRRVHDAGVGWVPPADAVWGAPPVEGAETVLCHGDPGPWNFVWQDGEAVGLLDWDYLHPGPRLDDVAYALRWFVPLRADTHALDWHHFPEVPDRAHRVRVFVEAYGDLPTFDVAATVARRIRATRDLMASLAARGVEPQRTWVADGAVAREDEEIRWVEEHRDLC
jgi:aminoglycoside phosphotransferase (APT) family kinase protein